MAFNARDFISWGVCWHSSCSVTSTPGSDQRLLALSLRHTPKTRGWPAFIRHNHILKQVVIDFGSRRDAPLYNLFARPCNYHLLFCSGSPPMDLSQQETFVNSSDQPPDPDSKERTECPSAKGSLFWYKICGPWVGFAKVVSQSQIPRILTSLQRQESFRFGFWINSSW